MSVIWEMITKMTGNTQNFSSPSSTGPTVSGSLLSDHYFYKMKTWIRSEIINNCLIRIWQEVLTYSSMGTELTTELIVQLRFPIEPPKPLCYLIPCQLPFYTAGFCSQNRGRHWRWRKSNHE